MKILFKHYHTCDNICRIIPPHIMEKLLESKEKKYRDIALRSMRIDNFVRLDRISTSQKMRAMRDSVTPEVVSEHKFREIYDAKNQEMLPGTLVKDERTQSASTDISITEAFNYLGATYDFYKEKYERNSIDNYGLKLIGTVHFGEKYNNAFWNGSQMTFGDGDGELFQRFTIDLDVVGHELAHGVTEYESGLIYRSQSGALNESYSDVFGIMIKQWFLKQTVEASDWLIGATLLVGDKYALRSMKAPGTAYIDHPQLGTDPQPATMDEYKELKPWEDNGGVHINSGIPNYAFYVAATELGGHAWEKAGLVWYKGLPRIKRDANFEEAANVLILVAGELFGEDSPEQNAVRKGWTEAKVI
ncbi:MAG: M4 family metallopeptidase [Candidatus Helarchaeota archaeon]